jgi:glycine C-acetyltransferase
LLAIENIGNIARGHHFLLPGRLDTPGRTAVGGRSVLNLASKNYLGLLDHPSIQSRIDPAFRSPDIPIGQDERRLMRDSLRCRLEDNLGRFLQKKSAYVAENCMLLEGAIPIHGLFTSTEEVIQDEGSFSLAHPNDRSAFCHQIFRHNDVDHLESILRERRRPNCLVIVDALYPETGDLAPIPQIVSLCKRYDAKLAVDESLSLGVLGSSGRGIQEHFELCDNDIEIKFGRLSNAFPSSCFFLAASSSLVRQLKLANEAEPTTRERSLSEFSSAIAGLEILINEPNRVGQLQDNARAFQTGVRLMGFQVRKMISPLVTIALRSCEEAAMVAQNCLKRGLFVASDATSPGVPKSCIQLHFSAIHSTQDIKFALRVFSSIAHELGYKISFE